MISASPLAARRLSRRRATNPELSAGKANVIAIIEAFGCNNVPILCMESENSPAQSRRGTFQAALFGGLETAAP
jgi:hypothetical protein